MKEKIKYILCFCAGVLITFSVSKYCQANTTFEEKGTIKKASFKDVAELQKIIETINLVDDVWVGDKKISIKDQYDAALRGIMANLDDPYSEYLTQEEYKDMNENLDGVYSGVGM